METLAVAERSNVNALVRSAVLALLGKRAAGAGGASGGDGLAGSAAKREK